MTIATNSILELTIKNELGISRSIYRFFEKNYLKHFEFELYGAFAYAQYSRVTTF